MSDFVFRAQIGKYFNMVSSSKTCVPTFFERPRPGRFSNHSDPIADPSPRRQDVYDT